MSDLTDAKAEIAELTAKLAEAEKKQPAVTVQSPVDARKIVKYQGIAKAAQDAAKAVKSKAGKAELNGVEYVIGDIDTLENIANNALARAEVLVDRSN